MSDSMTTVVVDVMGGDHAPDVVLEGVTAALEADSELCVLLVGPEAVVVPAAADRLEPVVASEVIEGSDGRLLTARSEQDLSRQTQVVEARVEGDRLLWRSHSGSFPRLTPHHSGGRVASSSCSRATVGAV